MICAIPPTTLEISATLFPTRAAFMCAAAPHRVGVQPVTAKAVLVSFYTHSLHLQYVALQTPVGCQNPCTGVDRCNSALSNNINTCIQIPNTCGQYVCSCSASGWSPASGGLSCISTFPRMLYFLTPILGSPSTNCSNPCLSGDPCTARAAGNTCVQTPGVCGQYICQCTAPGYFTAAGAQSCIIAATRAMCVNPCIESDPCSTSANPQNLCVQPLGTCGVYACACSGGWVPGFGAQSCNGFFLLNF